MILTALIIHHMFIDSSADLLIAQLSARSVAASLLTHLQVASHLALKSASLSAPAGELTAAQALMEACEECVKVCKHIGAVFDNAVDQYKQQKP